MLRRADTMQNGVNEEIKTGLRQVDSFAPNQIALVQPD